MRKSGLLVFSVILSFLCLFLNSAEASPTYSDQGSNETTIKAGEPVLLYTKWTNSVDLSYAILSTNETEEWENKTTYGSPLALSGTSDWSNFTWQNTSILTYKVIAWKIYANNTNNEWGTTGEETFTLDPRVMITLESEDMDTQRKIIVRPNSNTSVYGRATYSLDSSAYANEQISFSYDTTSLGSNTTNATGHYSFTFSIPYRGVYTLNVSAQDESGNSGINTSEMTIKYKPEWVKYSLTYKLGTSKTNDIFTIGTSPLINDTVNTTTFNITKYSSELDKSYICTYDNSEVSQGITLGLVHSWRKSDLDYVNFSNVGNEDYTLELKQDLESQTLLAYTKGTCENIHDKMYLVESQTIPSNPFASFSFPIPAKYLVEMMLQYVGFEINGTDRFPKGSYKICIEYEGTTQANKPLIGVNTC
jgi:hypothetical protein